MKMTIFKKSINPIVLLDVGMITKIREWLCKYHIENYVINDDLTIDVEGTVWLGSKCLTEFPPYIKFNNIKGNFDIGVNYFISLKGCPRFVSGSFGCDQNQLTSLEGCPDKTKNFYCDKNRRKFTKLEILQKCDVTNLILN